MQSRLDPRYYVSPDMYERERDRLFERAWLFFTLKPLLARDNAFVTRTLCGRSIVVQNIHGELCAFVADIYRFREEPADRCLRRYALRVVGNLVFVSLATDPIPFEDQFGPELVESMRASSETFSDDIAVTTLRHRFNWKLIYENLRDFNHVRFVHAKSLAKSYEFEPLIEEELVAEAARLDDQPLDRGSALSLLRRLSYHGLDSKPIDYSPLEWHHGIRRWQPEIAYFNWLVFPNLHIVTATGGHAFLFEHHIPTGSDTTDVVLYWVLARRDAPYPQAPAVLDALMRGTQSIVNEDFALLERLQRSLRADGPRSLVGAYEGQTMLVHQFYAQLMEGRFAL